MISFAISIAISIAYCKPSQSDINHGSMGVAAEIPLSISIREIERVAVLGNLSSELLSLAFARPADLVRCSHFYKAKEERAESGRFSLMGVSESWGIPANLQVMSACQLLGALA